MEDVSKQKSSYLLGCGWVRPSAPAGKARNASLLYPLIAHSSSRTVGSNLLHCQGITLRAQVPKAVVKGVAQSKPAARLEPSVASFAKNYRK
jgi:hypothetical protein